MKRPAILASIAGLLLAGCCFGGHLGLLVFGWIGFLGHVVPRMTFDPLAIAYACGALVMLLVGVHATARWLRGPTAPWRLGNSVRLVAGVIVLFAAGTAIVGIVHQTTWLFTRESTIYNKPSFTAAAQMRSANNLKNIALGVQNYHDQNKSLPLGGSFNRYGEGLHGWTAAILPFINVYHGEVDFQKPWHAEANRALYRGAIPFYINPSIRGAAIEEQGVPISHYAGNQYVLRSDEPLTMSQIKSPSQTLLVGEVNANFRAWPSPYNVRDPGLGVNRSPDGFGGPQWQGGAQFAMVDGSVRMISQDIDPGVLRMLGDPTLEKQGPSAERR